MGLFEFSPYFNMTASPEYQNALRTGKLHELKTPLDNDRILKPAKTYKWLTGEGHWCKANEGRVKRSLAHIRMALGRATFADVIETSFTNSPVWDEAPAPDWTVQERAVPVYCKDVMEMSTEDLLKHIDDAEERLLDTLRETGRTVYTQASQGDGWMAPSDCQPPSLNSTDGVVERHESYLRDLENGREDWDDEEEDY